MATALATKWPTLTDLAARLDPDGQIADIAEVISIDTPLLDDMPWREGNKGDGHTHTGRSAHAAAAFRRMNKGTAPVKSTVTQFTDSTGMLDMWLEVDEKLAQQSGDIGAFRASEEVDQSASMHEELESTIFYGNASSVPEEFTGIAPRYAAYTGGERATHVFNAGGSGADNTSIYLIGWGKEVFGIYPKGSKAGLDMRDMGVQRITDSDGYPLTAYVTHLTWDCGLAVRNWKYVVRIANIDWSKLQTAGTASDVSAVIDQMMLRALHLLPSRSNCKPVFYAHPDVVGMLAVKVYEKSNMAFTMGDVLGVNGLTRPGSLMFMGMPVHGTESIILTEAALTS